MQKHRPLGVTIIAMLTILGGLAFLSSAFVVLVIIPLFGIFLGGGLFIIGIAYFVMASGIGIILGIGSIIAGNIGALFHTIISAVVIYYLYRPDVKAFFGK